MDEKIAEKYESLMRGESVGGAIGIMPPLSSFDFDNHFMKTLET